MPTTEIRAFISSPDDETYALLTFVNNVYVLIDYLLSNT